MRILARKALTKGPRAHGQKKLEAVVERRALAELEHAHPHEPLTVLERQYHADRILAARRARAHKVRVCVAWKW